jgi:hypothetical protein
MAYEQNGMLARIAIECAGNEIDHGGSGAFIRDVHELHAGGRSQ